MTRPRRKYIFVRYGCHPSWHDEMRELLPPTKPPPPPIERSVFDGDFRLLRAELRAHARTVLTGIDTLPAHLWK